MTMKVKRIFSAAFATAMIMSTALNVSAKTSIDTNTEENTNFTVQIKKDTDNGVGHMFYDYGTQNFNDDVWAYCYTYTTNGMVEGHASVNLTGLNGKVDIKFNDVIENGKNYINSGNATIPGCDYAKRLRYEGARRDQGQDFVGFNYYFE